MSHQQPLLAHRSGPYIAASSGRVLLRRLYPSSHTKAQSIVDRIHSLPESQVKHELSHIIDEWSHRHEHLTSVFRHRYREVALNLRHSFQDWSDDRKLLVGAFFMHEYSIESAALFNPSIVAHPDQSGVESGYLRVIISLRATGEGHISSCTFREALLTHHNRIILMPSVPRLSDAKRHTTNIDRKKFLEEMQLSHMRTKKWGKEHTAFFDDVMKEVGHEDSDTMTVEEVRSACGTCLALHNGFATSQAADDACAAILMLIEANYTVEFQPESALSQRVLFPSAPSQSNGIEDCRFVRFTDDDGSTKYLATFTAYNGRSTLSQVMETKDFVQFRFISLSGDVKEKGMALFPRKINGQYVMLSRQDDESVMITFSQSLYKWEDPIPLLRPEQPWESFKMGNCGSPIETPAGWIVITHGVGPMRRYCLGAALLDLNDPSKVIARLKDPLIAPTEAEREGYVPNVVYSCGAMLHDNTLVIPYAMSDSVSSFATVNVTDLLREFGHCRVSHTTTEAKI